MDERRIKRVRTCVFPCAGYGTRFLPATKVIPKEMLPLVDKPVIQYGVEEALMSGLGRIVVITSRGKDSILDHFDRSFELEVSLRERDKNDLLAAVEETAGLTHVISVRQKNQLGLGHAVLQAAPAVGNEPFAVLLPDDVILAEPPCLHQMMEVYRETGRPVIALMEVPPDETHRYGVIAGTEVRGGLWKISRMVEKPKGNAPSNLAIIGRYILPPEIFPILEKTPKGAGEEIQLTDGLQELIAGGDVYGYVFRGRRYDAGEKLGYLKATVDFALRHPELGNEFREYLSQIADT